MASSEFEADPHHRVVDGLEIGQIADVDRDHAVGAHRPDHVGRDVVHGAAVDQHLAVALDRRKDQRQRHRRAQRRGQRTAIQRHRRGAEDVHGDGAERRRQRVERRDVVVGGGDPTDQQIHLLTVVEGGRGGDAAFQPELEARRIGARVGLAPDVLEGKARGAEHLVPVQALQHIVELGGVQAGGEGAADQATHAGAGGEVNRNAMVLEPADHADVRDTARAAAAERDADGGPLDVNGRPLGLSGRAGKRDDDCDREKVTHHECPDTVNSLEIACGRRYAISARPHDPRGAETA